MRILRHLSFAILLGAGALVIGVFATRDRPPPPPRRDALATALARVSTGKAARLYREWATEHERRGGDRNIVIALGPTGGHGQRHGGARGAIQLDLLGGVLQVELAGLPGDHAWDVWLVEQRPDGADDATLKVATLGAGEARARVDLGAERLGALDVTSVRVTPAGRASADEAVLSGTPTSFQQLYTRARTGRQARTLAGLGRRTGGAAIGNLLRLREAMAAGTVVDPDVLLEQLVADGAELFINETFGGNGRTCATCHPASRNFTIDPEFIATLPPSDPLFVNETNPALADLEHSVLLRTRALIKENVDGFDKPGVFRSVPHTLAMRTSLQVPICSFEEGCAISPVFLPGDFYPHLAQMAGIDVTQPVSSGFPAADLVLANGTIVTSLPAERTGWGGDGSPGAGTLKEFATGAVIQHFPKTLNRVAGVDFRLPTDYELMAMEAFQLSLGRQEDLDLQALSFTDPVVERGREIFITDDTDHGTKQAGKCEVCHANAGASSTPEVFGAAVARAGFTAGTLGNLVFDTGVNNIVPNRLEMIAPGMAPHDGGFGILPNFGTDAQGQPQCRMAHVDFTKPPTDPGFIVFDDRPMPGGFGGHGQFPFFPQGGCLEQFNTPPLIEAADTPPFFHNNEADTIEDAVAFYSTDAFNDGLAEQLFLTGVDTGLIGIRLTDESNRAVAKFLRVLNANENLRQASELDQAALTETDGAAADQLIDMAVAQLRDARVVLAAVQLHPSAVGRIDAAIGNHIAARSSPPGSSGRASVLYVARINIDAASLSMVTPLP